MTLRTVAATGSATRSSPLSKQGRPRCRRGPGGRELGCDGTPHRHPGCRHRRQSGRQPAAQGVRQQGRDRRRRPGRRPHLPARPAVRPLRARRSCGDRALTCRAAAPGDRLPHRRRRPRRCRALGRAAGRRHRAALRRARDRDRRRAPPRGDRGHDRARLGRLRVHVLHARRSDRPARRATPAPLRPPGRERRRPADQVPGGTARVLLPGRLVPAQARCPRAGRPAVRDPARRRVHEAGRVGASDRPARARRGSRSRPSSPRARSTAPADGWSAGTSARSGSTCS